MEPSTLEWWFELKIQKIRMVKSSTAKFEIKINVYCLVTSTEFDKELTA